MTILVSSGSQRALSVSQTPTSAAPIYLAELLASINRKDGTHEAMLHSVAARFLEFLGSTVEHVPIDMMHEKKEPFIAYLKASKYTSASVKSYRNYLNLLLRRAEDLGWVRPVLVIPTEWQEIANVMPRTSATLIIRYAVRIRKSPAAFSEEDLHSWRQERARAGRSLVDAERDCSRFRNAIAKAGLSHLVPLIKPRDKRYGVALDAMHPALRDEIQRIITWKLNELEIDRPAGARIRPISAKRLKDLFGQITGFMQNIEHQPEVTSVTDLVTRENIALFMSWAVNNREVKGQSLSTGLGMVYAALRHYPSYKALDWSWFDNIIDQLPIEPQSTIDVRKAKKYLPYSEAEQIPKRIRKTKMKLKRPTLWKEALYAQNELLMLWIILLPWRQRNIRELRVTGQNPNLFKAPIAHYCTATRPRWIDEEERRSPGSSFWQVRFDPSETKMGHPVQLFLPSELVPLVEDYLSKYRPTLLQERIDPGTLFINRKGKPMSISQVRNLVKKLASEHTGVPVTPHIYRDIVAYEWLRTHPEDYLTVSKALWHRNINTTIRIYGHRFDESTGVARMDDWRTSRN